MDNIGDVTYDNPVYEADEDEYDASNRLVQMPDLNKNSSVSFLCERAQFLLLCQFRSQV